MMIKAVIADDSAFLRQFLKDILDSSKKIEVIGCAKNGKEAVNFVKELSPDVLILDCEMPVMNGLEALRIIMDENPLPVFMFSSLTWEGASVTLKALEYGAVDFLLKPVGGIRAIEKISDDLVNKIVNIVRTNKLRKLCFRQEPKKNIFGKQILIEKGNIDLIAVGSSTGGVQASIEIIRRLPDKTKPIVWVQHMPESFTKSFAERLNTIGKIRVKEAENGDILENNTCYIAPGGKQMRVNKGLSKFELKVEGTEKVSGHCPSCNVLFESVAKYFSNNVIGVILTGMGDDGARELLTMHSKGAFVIGQNEKSCVVYGMPKSASKIGAVDIECDICDIADTIIKKGGAIL